MISIGIDRGWDIQMVFFDFVLNLKILIWSHQILEVSKMSRVLLIKFFGFCLLQIVWIGFLLGYYLL